MRAGYVGRVGNLPAGDGNFARSLVVSFVGLAIRRRETGYHIHAVAAVLEGGRGGVDLPRAVQNDVRERVAKYYRKMDEDVPW